MDDRPARPNRLLFRNLITQIQSVSHQPISGTKIHLERLGGRKDGVGKSQKWHTLPSCVPVLDPAPVASGTCLAIRSLSADQPGRTVRRARWRAAAWVR
jgi:hypothetical protein